VTAAPADQNLRRSEERRVVLASTLGTVFEWYDFFFIYGSLAVFMGSVLFPPDNPTAAVLASHGALAAGFVIRPIGAVVFGRIGDLVGRKTSAEIALNEVTHGKFNFDATGHYARPDIFQLVVHDRPKTAVSTVSATRARD
jgi:hypothetical protein